MSSKKLRDMLDIQMNMYPEKAIDLIRKNALPDNVKVLGDLDLIKLGKDVTSLPKNLSVMGDLSVSLEKLKKLPDCIHVEGDICLERFMSFKAASKHLKSVLGPQEPFCMWVDIPLAGGGIGTERSIEYLTVRHAIEEECTDAGVQVNGGGMGLNKMDISFTSTDAEKDVPLVFKILDKHKLRANPCFDVVYYDDKLDRRYEELIRFTFGKDKRVRLAKTKNLKNTKKPKKAKHGK